MKKEKRFR